MRGGRLRTGLRIAVSTAIGLSLALTANYLALAQPQPHQTGPARDRAGANATVSKLRAAPATAHAVACSESFGKDFEPSQACYGLRFHERYHHRRRGQRWN